MVVIGFLPVSLLAQHTFSIVAVDSVSGEIGSAGATCGDSIVWPGTPGARIISEIIPGTGAIHTQSYYLKSNQDQASARMKEGKSPAEIIQWLIANDAEGDPGLRQYGIADYNNGHPRTAAYTGSGCFDYKNHITGKNYAIQGNILLSQAVLDSMEAGFKRSKGSLAEKLMASMLAAKIVGADSRCATYGISSLSSFLRVAKKTDAPQNLYLDIRVPAVPSGTDPIDLLHTRFLAWKATAKLTESIQITPPLKVYPNPVGQIAQFENTSANPLTFELFEAGGRKAGTFECPPGICVLNFDALSSGYYLLRYACNERWYHQSFIKKQH